MLEKGLRYLRSLRGFGRINMSLARGHASRSSRHVELSDTTTWEFSGFSQNGEDGLLEVLLDNVREPNRYFVEIGSSDGLENNTSWLSLVHRYSGLWIEGDPVTASRSRELFGALNNGVKVMQALVTPQNIGELVRKATQTNPDVFSLDIDSYDYFVAAALLRLGLRPRVFVVEYNSAFGPDAQVTVPEEFKHAERRGTADKFYYGCSISAYRTLFNQNGYRFVTVDRNGVNAFFIDPAAFDPGFLAQINSVEFAENYAQLVDCAEGWKGQWALIKDRRFVTVE